MVAQKGFTLVELIVSLVVFAILITVGLPNFSDFIRRYTAESTMMSLHKDIQLARAEAVSLGKRVTICHLNGTNCDGNWLQGVTVFVDDGATTGTLEAGELKLVESNPIGTEHQFKAQRNRLTFRPDGMATGFADNFIFCPKGGNAKHNRGIIISNTGSTRRTQDTNDDGIHELANGTKLGCS